VSGRVTDAAVATLPGRLGFNPVRRDDHRCMQLLYPKRTRRVENRVAAAIKLNL